MAGNKIDTLLDAVCAILPDASGKTCMVRTYTERHAISKAAISLSLSLYHCIQETFTSISVQFSRCINSPNGGVISPVHFRLSE